MKVRSMMHERTINCHGCNPQHVSNVADKLLDGKPQLTKLQAMCNM
jgi:hypothetical protein